MGKKWKAWWKAHPTYYKKSPGRIFGKTQAETDCLRTDHKSRMKKTYQSKKNWNAGKGSRDYRKQVAQQQSTIARVKWASSSANDKARIRARQAAALSTPYARSLKKKNLGIALAKKNELVSKIQFYSDAKKRQLYEANQAWYDQQITKYAL